MFPDVQTSQQARAARRRDQRPGGPRLAPVETNDLKATDAAALDEAAVAAAFRTGDAAAADAVVQHLLPEVDRLVRRLSAWSCDADDLVQDVLVTALVARASFRGDAKLGTWIARIAVNCCRAHARKTWLRKRLVAAWAVKLPAAHAAPADVKAVDDEQAAMVRRAVAELPIKYREAIVLCYLQNMTAAEAAEALGVKRGTVEVRLSRARDKLRELIEM
jgi:RNA polymerase sigma factor (sigma-70 family)